MKKHGILVLVVLLLVSLLTGCGNSAETETPESPFVGKWIATQAELNGINVDVKDIAGNLNIIVEANGKVVASIDDLTENGTWEASEDGKGFNVHLTDLDLAFVPEEEGKMTATFQDVIFTFEKEEETLSTEALSDSAE